MTSDGAAWIEDAASYRQPAHVPRPGEHLFIGACVLVVDDNTSNRVALFDQLTTWRLHPGQAATSAAALVMLRRAAAIGEPYQVALVDQSMPDMAVADLIREVRADESLAATGLVLLSPAGALCVAAGMDDYISKPMLYDDVAAALARWVEPTGATPGAAHVAVAPPIVAPVVVPVAVDEERLETLRMINPADPALLGTLVAGFLAEAPGLLADIRSAADSGDCAALATSSHRLRGAALTMGLPAVAAVSGELESLGGTGRIAGATDLVARVAADLATAAAALPVAAGRAHPLP